MTMLEKDAVRAMIKVLRSRRNRFGKLEVGMDDTSREGQGALQNFAKAFEIPHGGVDSCDQIQMVLARMIGDPCTSVSDL